MFIKKVGEEEIDVIQLLAKTTWEVAYKSILSEDQLAYMLQLFYSKDALQNQMQQGLQFIFAIENNQPIAFASYGLKSNLSNQFIYHLHKIYALPNQQGKGVGKFLLNFIINDIKPTATALELNVNRYNNAVTFYQKQGFEIVEEVDISIGNGYFMNDYIMKKLI